MTPEFGIIMHQWYIDKNVDILHPGYPIAGDDQRGEPDGPVYAGHEVCGCTGVPTGRTQGTLQLTSLFCCCTQGKHS